MNNFCKISVFPLMFVGTSDSSYAFAWSTFLIPFEFPLCTIPSELETFLKAVALGWFLYLTTAFKIASEVSPKMFSQSWYSGTLKAHY